MISSGYVSPRSTLDIFFFSNSVPRIVCQASIYTHQKSCRLANMVSKTTESTAYARVEPRSSLKRQRSARLFTMTGSLLAGLVLAIVQCIFYWYLSGKTVGSTIPQAWASRVGTALAFLVKLLFATAASTAYVQRQWLALSKTSLKIRQIDSLTGILSNLLLFRDFNLWWTHPLLSCLATITWYE